MIEKQELINIILENCIELEEKKYCGVYFLIYKNQIIYVGQSKDIKQRINQHRKQKNIIFTHWYCQVYENEISRTDRERYFINKLRPKHNKEFNPDYNINTK